MAKRSLVLLVWPVLCGMSGQAFFYAAPVAGLVLCCMSGQAFACAARVAGLALCCVSGEAFACAARQINKVQKSRQRQSLQKASPICLLELMVLVNAMTMNMRILCAGGEELMRVRMSHPFLLCRLML